MSVASETAPIARGGWSVRLLQLVFVYLLGLKLWFGLAVSPMGDESYYWMWGQHLSWSYFDHPPLDGWLQGLMAALFGWSNLSVRLLSWLTLGGTLWIFWLWSARLAPEDRSDWFWHTAVIYLAIPVVFLMTTFAFHDHLLLFLVAASAYAFDGFARTWEDGHPQWRRLYCAAALLGLAVLTKYNGVFLGLAYAVWILARPSLRRLFLTPHLWLAALLAIAIQAPVFYWNLTEGMASFRFHLSERPSVNWHRPDIRSVLGFIATLIPLMSPILFLSLFRLPWSRPSSAEDRRAGSLSVTIFLVSTLAWTAIAAYVYVYLHWNVIAYAALAPIALRLLGRRLGLWLHVGYGVVLISGAIMSYTVTPLSFRNYADQGAAASYGWPELAQHVAAQQARHPGSFLGAARYTYAAQLGFQLHNTDVAAFNDAPSQNDYWWDAPAHLGKDAIIVADRAFGIGEAKKRFRSVEKLETVPVVRFGKTIWTFDIYLGSGFTGAAK